MKNDSQPTLAASHWTELWRTGVLHSCSHGIEGNYDGELRAFWTRSVAALPQGACVLDVGTGNGAIPLLVHGQRPDLKLIGVDIADVHPHRDVADGERLFAGIRFLPCTPMHDIPLPDGSVDLLTSQYAFEYADQAPALQEFARLLSASGRIAWIVHSTHSEIARMSARQAHAMRTILQSDGVFERAERVIQFIGNARSGGGITSLASNTDAENARHAFNQAASALIDAALAEPDLTAYSRSVQVLQSTMGNAPRYPDDALANLHRGRIVLAEETVRLKELQCAARSVDDMQDLASALQAHGFETRFSPLHYHDKEMGWVVEATRG